MAATELIRLVALACERFELCFFIGTRSSLPLFVIRAGDVLLVRNVCYASYLSKQTMFVLVLILSPDFYL